MTSGGFAVNLRQQIIQTNIERTAANLGISEDLAFVRLVHSLVTENSLYAFDENDLVEGGQEKQIDTFTITQDRDEAEVYVIQCKNTETFSSNALVLFKNGLDWILNKRRAEVEKLGNTKLRDRILEFRSVQSGIGPSNIRFTAIFATNGLTSDVSDEFRQEFKSILIQYDNGTFESFKLDILGAEELTSKINAIEKHGRKVNAEIKIRYDANNPSLIKYHAEGLQGVVCTAAAREIAAIVNKDPQGFVFDSNIRRFLGLRGTVNSEIMVTCSKPDTSFLFWFLNNGITIACDRFDAVTDPDNPHIKIENMQIINGCQTATALALAEKAGELASDSRVLLRIYQTTSPDLVDRIVLTTNNQNKISSRDLRANDPVQRDMERGFSLYGYFYERKLRQYENQAEIDTQRILPNEVVAQAYLSIVLGKPSDGRGRKYKIWSELYQQIFGGRHVIEPYVLSILMFRASQKWLRASPFVNDADELRRKVANSGVFHVARIAASFYRKGDRWNLPSDELKKQITELTNVAKTFEPYISKGYELLCQIIRNDETFRADIDRALKAYNLDEAINSHLRKKKATVRS